MFGINRQNGHAVFGCKARNKAASHHKGFLVGQRNVFPGFNGTNGRFQTCKAHQGRKHQVNAVHLHNLAYGFSSCINLNVMRLQGKLYFFIIFFIADHYSIGHKLDGLLYE